MPKRAKMESRDFIANEVLIELLRRIEEEIESYIETLEVLNDPEVMKSVKKGLKDFEKGRVISFEEFVKKFGLKE